MEGRGGGDKLAEDVRRGSFLTLPGSLTSMVTTTSPVVTLFSDVSSCSRFVLTSTSDTSRAVASETAAGEDQGLQPHQIPSP